MTTRTTEPERRPRMTTPTDSAAPLSDPTTIPPDGTEARTYAAPPVRRRVGGLRTVPGVPGGLSVVEVSELLGISQGAVRRAKASGELVGGGRPLRFFPASVEAYRAAHARRDVRADREVRAEAHKALRALEGFRERRGGLSADLERVVDMLSQVSGPRPRDPESPADLKDEE